MGLTWKQRLWLLQTEQGRNYSFYNNASAWREVGKPLKEMGLVQWVADPRQTAVVLTYAGEAMRDELKRTETKETR